MQLQASIFKSICPCRGKSVQNFLHTLRYKWVSKLNCGTHAQVKLGCKHMCTNVLSKQLRSQALPRWATSGQVAHPEGQNEESLRRNKKQWWKFEEKWRKWNYWPPGTARLATPLCLSAVKSLTWQRQMDHSTFVVLASWFLSQFCGQPWGGEWPGSLDLPPFSFKYERLFGVCRFSLWWNKCVL